MKTLSPHKLWIVTAPGITDITVIYTDKADAEKEAERHNNEIKHTSIINHVIYKVVSLYDGIELIKEDIYDSNSSWGDPSY
jgi:hypothetical protein